MTDYELKGLSFREYLGFEGLCDHEPIALDDILENHVVLADQDVFTCEKTDIGKTKVVETWFGGEQVYQTPGSEESCTVVVGNGAKALGETNPSSLATNFTISGHGKDYTTFS